MFFAQFIVFFFFATFGAARPPQVITITYTLSFTPTPVGNAQESKVEEILQWVDMNKYTVNIANILKGFQQSFQVGLRISYMNSSETLQLEET